MCMNFTFDFMHVQIPLPIFILSKLRKSDYLCYNRSRSDTFLCFALLTQEGSKDVPRYAELSV